MSKTYQIDFTTSSGTQAPVTFTIPSEPDHYKLSFNTSDGKTIKATGSDIVVSEYSNRYKLEFTLSNGNKIDVGYFETPDASYWASRLLFAYREYYEPKYFEPYGSQYGLYYPEYVEINDNHYFDFITSDPIVITSELIGVICEQIEHDHDDGNLRLIFGFGDKDDDGNTEMYINNLEAYEDQGIPFFIINKEVDDLDQPIYQKASGAWCVDYGMLHDLFENLGQALSDDLKSEFANIPITYITQQYDEDNIKYQYYDTLIDELLVSELMGTFHSEPIQMPYNYADIYMAIVSGASQLNNFLTDYEETQSVIFVDYIMFCYIITALNDLSMDLSKVIFVVLDAYKSNEDYDNIKSSQGATVICTYPTTNFKELKSAVTGFLDGSFSGSSTDYKVIEFVPLFAP